MNQKMERTLKESQALKQAQNIAEGFETSQDPNIATQMAVVWAVIALHEVVDRLIDVINDLPEEMRVTYKVIDE